jgi:site-specific DNA recombinase
MATKRVVCLYRVSTKGQVDKNDIPMQKTECRNFIQLQPDWALVNEYYEKGVSGYKKSAIERDVLQQVKTDALKNKFDILLVFMFDRLGRKEDETPFIVEWFSKQGIEIWSTQEGQQKFDNHTDKLINYIRFWQASGESEKTSIRVDIKHEQMTQDGLYRGGIAPYGYKIVPSGILNKKKKEVGKLIIDTESSEIIKMIYQYVYDFGYGNSLIAQKLNDNHIPSASGGNWRPGVVGYILRNPIYKGYPTYKKSTRKNDISGHLPKSEWISSKEQQADLIIINESIWDEVQKIRESKKTKNNNRNPQHSKITKSPLLFVGIIYCGYCHGSLTTNYLVKYNKTKTKKYRNAVYRCSTKSMSSQLCDGQTAYSGNKIDSIVLEELYQHLKKIVIELSNNPNQSSIDKKKSLNTQITKLNMIIVKIQKEKEMLLKEISNCLMGDSKFTQDDLSQLIHIKEQELQSKKDTLELLKKELSNFSDNQNQKEQLSEVISSWNDKFLKLDLNKQKMALRKIIQKIIVYKDHVDIEFFENLSSFLSLVSK